MASELTQEQQKLKKNGIIVEGTAGNTGIGLALIGNSFGFKSVIVMPKTQSEEKKNELKKRLLIFGGKRFLKKH